MVCGFVGGVLMAATVNVPASVIHSTSTSTSTRSISRIRVRVRCQSGLGGVDDDLNLKAAINRASLRYRETNLAPDPLFLDPYAGCFVDSDAQQDLKQSLTSGTSTDWYCLATKFIDDWLLNEVSHIDGVKQIVLLTDGMETRPYRLKWPNSSVFFDVSPETIFRSAAQKLEGVGAKIPRSCLRVHVPTDSPNIQETLCRKGFNGNRPSIWVLQGLPLMTLASLVDILATVSNLAMKGCFFIGELPAWLAETEIIIKPDLQKWMTKLFMSNGFRVDVISYDKVAKDMGRYPPSGDCRNILFVAEHLRLSDAQMESWRQQLLRLEEEGDEEGFEEL